jgi:Zn-dependent protease/CBS domain-containing protein
MKWSFKIGRFAGIDVYMHFTFLLLVSWVALIHWQQGRSIAAAVAGVVFILAVFMCVILHEFGHALTARRYGINPRDIILWPIGGLARLERIPTQPLQELWVALAGPAVNVVITIGLFVWLNLTASLEPLQAMTLTTGPFLERIMAVNIFLVAFNMIPAFPMDGGRVLRAILATRKDYGRATQIAAAIGQAIAVIFGFVGLFYNPLLLFIAFFVWIGASQEASMAQLRSAIGGIPVQQAMITDFKTLHVNDSLDQAVALTLAGTQKDFPVADNGHITGVLTQTDLMKALSERDRHPTVASALQRNFVTVDSLEMLETAFAKLQNCNCHTLPVTHNGELVGLVTMDNLGEYMRLHGAKRN